MPIVPSKVRVSLLGSCYFSFDVGTDDELLSWTWELKDAFNNAIPFYEAGKEPKGFDGFTWYGSISENTRQFVASKDPTYGRVFIKTLAQIKDKKGKVRTETSQAEVTFAAVWGGLMRAQYPYPSDADKPWGGDPKGERALVLMFDLINQLPDELRGAAGSIPITRSAGLPFAGGFHAPYVSDSIIITEGYVSMVSPGSPVLTDGDMKFVSVVLHEIAHAVTYQRSSVNIHGVLAAAHKALRHPVVGLAGGYKISFGVAGLLSFAHALIFGDFVSGFAHVARWELTAWYFRLARLLSPVHDVLDLIYWLSHLNESSGPPAVNPNVITGYWAIGNPLGLRNNFIDYDAIKKLQEEEFAAWETLQQAEADLHNAIGKPAAEVAAAQKAKDDAEAGWKAKRQAVRDALAGSGAVSQYATTDVLEDIAETVTVLTFGAQRLNAMRLPFSPVGTPINPRNTNVFLTHTDAGKPTDGFANRRRYLIEDAGIFPKNWTPMEPGRFMRGLESFDQLDQWQVER